MPDNSALYAVNVVVQQEFGILSTEGEKSRRYADFSDCALKRRN
jgi:hypothetical protein